MMPTSSDTNKHIHTLMLSLIVLVITAISAYAMCTYGYWGEQMRDSASLMAIGECILLFIWLTVGLYICHQNKRIGTVVLWIIVAVFLWMHRILLPIVATGLYVIALAVLGEIVLLSVRKKLCCLKSGRVLRVGIDILTGFSIWILIICILSIFHLADITTVRIVTISMGLAVGVAYVLLAKSGNMPLEIAEETQEDEVKDQGRAYKKTICILAAIMTMVLMQAGRMNIAIDYDSLHYGLRSETVLDSSGSIYDDYGMVNDVYVYPKGAEILALPLSSKNTYGYILALSWWMGVLTVLLVYEWVSKLRNSSVGLMAGLMIATMPGIMNMAISAKPDMMTLAMQLIALYCMAEHISEENKSRARYSIMAAIGAALLSLTMKPTSVLFTGLIVIVGVIYAMINRHRDTVHRMAHDELWVMLTSLLPALSLIAVTARTWILTGVPITSAYTGVCTAIGMRLKYPLAAGANGTSGGLVSVHTWLDRITQMMIAPCSDDMLHVYIAWGGVLILIAVAAIAIAYIRHRGELSPAVRYLLCNMVVLTIISILTLGILGQVDGNYYMLTYTVIVICFAVLIRSVDWVAPAIIYAAIICVYTNWAGVSGLTPIRWNHAGFYDHKTDMIDAASGRGVLQIYDYLNTDRSAHALAMAYQPECFMTDNIIQSYTDIEGSCGNVALVKTLDDFKGFLDYADISYIYVEEDYISEHDRASDIVTYMIEDGSLTEAVTDKGGMLYSYEHMPTLP